MFIFELEHEGFVIFFVAELEFFIVVRFHFVFGFISRYDVIN